MFQWIKRLLSRRRDDGTFSFHDGWKRRRADPIAVWRKLEAEGGTHWMDLLEPLRTDPATLSDKGLERVHLARQHAIEEICKWVRKAFGIPPFEEDGLSESACLDLLALFLQFINRMDADYRPFAISRLRDSPSPSTPTTSG